RRRLATTALATFVVGAAVTAAFGTYAGVLVGFALIGLAKPTFDVAAHSYLADRTPYDRRARVLGILELTWAGSMLVGAPVVGWLIARYGWQSPFWVLAAIVAVVAVTTHVALGPDRPTAAAGEPARWTLRLDRSAWGLLGVIAVASLAAETSFVVFGAWLEDRFALSLVALGGAGAAIAVAELAGSTTVLGVADRIGKRTTVMVGIAAATSGFVFLPAAERLASGLTLFALALYGYELTIVAAIPLASELRPESRGRYLSLLVVAVGLGRAVGAAIGPALFEAFGIAADVVVSVVGNLIAIVILAAFVVEHPEHGRPPPPPPSHVA
ncbi:MAG: MFS transporter, partial [Nitriliruptorales bacterium]